MGFYILRRFVLAIIIILIVTIIVFMAMRLLPGDPILMWLTQDDLRQLTSEQIEILRHDFGLDKPLYTQYLDWIGGVFQGDLGMSIRYNASVTSEVVRRIPITLHLGFAAFILGFVLGIPAGVICAVRRGTWIDTVVTSLTNIGITIPVFWLGIILLYIFSMYLRWLPTYGYTSPFEDFWLNTRQVIIPIICLALFPIASTARQTRSSMLEVMQQDYIRTAWSKGLKEKTVIMKHGLKNGLIPVVTLSGLGLGGILGGSVLVESVFAIPGMGRLVIASVQNHDYAVTQGVTLIIAAGIIFVNLIVDISYGWLDPRIRLG
ncbi:MAG: peptide ABC transporter [Chloroflexi bacterium RBG_13_52_12]|nr:MAG: peptide ABC transporter [Chloroflexi bacterium RBG_13_52_12]